MHKEFSLQFLNVAIIRMHSRSSCGTFRAMEIMCAAITLLVPG